jgi:RNA polymerase sigma-70 factor, ECF subfamily
MTEDSDSSLIRAVLAGDGKAYGALVERYQRPIYNLMLRATGSRDEAADLTQETFLKGYEKIGSHRGESSFFSWIYAIGLNQVRDHLRRRKRDRLQIGPGIDVEEAADPESAEEFFRSLQGITLRRAITELELHHREAVILRYREGLSMEEIAGIMGLTVSGAKMRVHRGLERLKAIMNGAFNGKQDEKSTHKR